MHFHDKKLKQSSVQEVVDKFWGRITELITGPEHEYVYLKRLIHRVKDYYPKKSEKVYLRRKVK